MKTKNILSLILLLTILCGFNSCEDKPLDEVYEPEYYLCNGSGWIDTYRDINGYICDQILVFLPDGRGRETIIRYFSDFPGDLEEINSNFRWYWDDDYYESIFIEFPNSDYYLFDDLFVGPDRLSVLLDGERVNFEPF